MTLLSNYCTVWWFFVYFPVYWNKYRPQIINYCNFKILHNYLYKSYFTLLSKFGLESKSWNCGKGRGEGKYPLLYKTLMWYYFIISTCSWSNIWCAHVDLISLWLIVHPVLNPVVYSIAKNTCMTCVSEYGSTLYVYVGMARKKMAAYTFQLQVMSWNLC